VDDNPKFQALSYKDCIRTARLPQTFERQVEKHNESPVNFENKRVDTLLFRMLAYLAGFSGKEMLRDLTVY